MRAWKKFYAALHIVYLFLLEKQINIDLLNLMTIRKHEEVDSLCTSLLASACARAFQATPSLERGDLGCGMIHLGCHLALVEIRFDCQRCRMPCGFLARLRRVICRSKTLRLRRQQMAAPFSAKKL